MRYLTVRREKSFVACLMKARVYIEDPEGGSVKIDGVRCSRLGSLKNGQERVFTISSKAARVYVIYGKASRHICRDCFVLPEGDSDVFLTGKSHFNPFIGNPFRFEGNDSPEAIKSRRKASRRFVCVLLALAIIGFGIGFGIGYYENRTPTEKTFSSHGISLVLNSAFKETNEAGFTVCFESKDVAVFCLKESFSRVKNLDQLTLTQYAQLVLNNNKLTADIVQADNLTYFVQTRPGESGRHRFYAFCFRTDDAFWLVQFSVSEEKADEFNENILSWAKSVSFA